jgi:hypothetical protein
MAMANSQFRLFRLEQKRNGFSDDFRPLFHGRHQESHDAHNHQANAA